MKFLVDAHLPPGLCRFLNEAGHDALHTSDLPGHNLTSDQELNLLSVCEQRVLISKDSDFYYSHLLHGRPWKLLLVRPGNIGTRELQALIREHLSVILSALEHHSLVELDREAIRVVA